MRKYSWKGAAAIVLGAVLSWGAIGYAETDAAAETAADAKTEEVETGVVLPWEESYVLPDGIWIGGIDLSGSTIAEARQKVTELGNQLLNRSITAKLNGHEYTSSAQDLGVTWENTDVVDEALTHVDRGSFVTRYKNKKDLENEPVKLDIELNVPHERVAAHAQNIVAAANVSTYNATIVRTGTGFEIVPSTTGLEFNTADIENQIYTQLEDQQHTGTIAVETEPIVTQPTVSESAFANFKGQILGTYTTKFEVSSKTTNRCENIQQSASNMNGTIIMPGDTVSTLAMFKDITKANGYSMAGTYLDGKVVDGIGGGICQTTTTLYDAVLMSELEVVYRRNHSMLVDYVDPGMDATVDYGSKSDFKFKNNTENPIYIESYRKDNTVTVTIYGTETRPANRTIAYESNVLEWSYPATESNPLFHFVVDSSLPTGWAPVNQKQYVVTDCHPQVQAELYKNVYVDGVLTERTKIGGLNKYRYSSGTVNYASDCKISAYDPNPGSTQKRTLRIDCTFKDGSPIGARPN